MVSTRALGAVIPHKSGVAAARRAKCRDVEAVTGVGGKSVRVLFVGGPIVDGRGVPGHCAGVLGVVVGEMVDLVNAHGSGY